jgi:hypothetical protein
LRRSLEFISWINCSTFFRRNRLDDINLIPRFLGPFVRTRTVELRDEEAGARAIARTRGLAPACPSGGIGRANSLR